MNDSTRAATRLGCAALLTCAMSVTGCAMDSEGYIHWTQPPRDSAYAQPHTVHWNGHHGGSREFYWNGQRPVVRGGGLGVRPRIDTSKLTVTAPK